MTIAFSLVGRTVGSLIVTLLLTSSPLLASNASAQDSSQSQPAVDGSENTPDLLTEEELEVLVARIALYPDELVAVISSASLFPLQIVEAERFLQQSKSDKDLKPKDSWDGSVISLLNYPQVVKMMSDDLEWTQALGSALSFQQKDVLIAVQTLRDKAVAGNVIKSDDKITVVNEGDNVVIQSKDPEKIYVPQYEPQMLYEPGYPPAPVAYYPDPYPNYYYPTAPFFAAAVTGVAWASVMDWDDWGVWGGDWHGGDVDIDCDGCFNNIDIDRDKLKFNDVDWKNVDRSKIKFDRNQFNRIDHNALKSDFKSNRNNNISARAKNVRRGHGDTISGNHPKVSVGDIRKSKVDADRIRNRESNIRPGNARQAAGSHRQGASDTHIGSKHSPQHVTRHAKQPKPGAHAQRHATGNHSVLGHPGNRHQTHLSSNRGRHSMGGGHRGGGGHKVVGHGGGRHR